MTNNHVIYRPGADEIDKIPIKQTYIEIWRGLPDLPFKETLSTELKDGGKLKALVYEREGAYIWITPMAVDALEQDPQTILYASIEKTKSRKINAWWVEPTQGSHFGDTLESAVRKAMILNHETATGKKKKQQSPAEDLEGYFIENQQ